jgi:uroporphyrinogen-III synthase
MRDRQYTILATASIPFERILQKPETVEIQMIPFIEILPRQNEQLIKQIHRLATEKNTVVFTSANAVRWATGMLTQKPDWIIYCIRYETRIAVEKWFGKEYILKTADNAKDLSELILVDKIKEAVFFCGDQRLDILPDILKKNGVKLTELIVYETRRTPIRIENQPDAILFFSPTAVKSFFSMNALSSATTLFAMGKTTAVTLKQFTSLPVIISPEADKSFVLNMAIEHASSHPIT